MRLSDIMSAMNLAYWPTIALVIFFATFVAIVLYALLKPRKEVDRWARLPMQDGLNDSQDADHAVRR